MPLLRTLFNSERGTRQPLLTPQLAELYDGDLRFLRGSAHGPYTVANFVSTLDGVVSYKLPGLASGSTISAADAADRFVMGLLRASVDAIIFGAHTLNDTEPESLWTPAGIYPAARELYADYRANVLHKPGYPLVVIVSGAGKIDLQRAALRAPDVRTLIVTTSAGERELLTRGVRTLPSVEVTVLDRASPALQPAAIAGLLTSRYAVQTLLHEGGPTLFGEFVSAGIADELFLTLSPQMAGRLPRSDRPGLVQGREFLPDAAPWFDLMTLKQRDAYLYLRYRRKDQRQRSKAKIKGKDQRQR
jgi:riboflavin biosynthesis pyrimidine reductase